jgi:hypothetical protein
MKMEVASLLRQSTYNSTPRSEAARILKYTWVIKLKRCCVRGDHQQERVDFFETYTYVCQWSTFIMILTMVLQNVWANKQVDYTQ